MYLSKMFKWGDSGPALPEAIKKLKQDFMLDNAATRDDDLCKWDFERSIKEAKEVWDKDRKNPDKLLRLAESYGILESSDKRCLEACGDLMAYNLNTMDVQRQGDFWALYGRSLFLNDRYDEALLAFLKARTLHQEKGNKQLRKRNNISLLRAYSCLGKSRLAAERLEVALTLCDEHDDTIMLYLHAKHALEETGNARDAEVLDDIWYVQMDMNKELKKKFESYTEMGDNVGKRLVDTPDRVLDWHYHWERFRDAVCESCKDRWVKTSFCCLMVLLMFNIMLMLNKK